MPLRPLLLFQHEQDGVGALMQGMRDVLRGSLARSLRDLSEEDRLAIAWPIACGSALAGHGEIQNLDGDRMVHVRVDGAAWMRQFLQMRSVLANDLARVAGVKLAGIHFEEQGAARVRAAKKTVARGDAGDI